VEALAPRPPRFRPRPPLTLPESASIFEVVGEEGKSDEEVGVSAGEGVSELDSHCRFLP
jgi:hypothetical protein